MEKELGRNYLFDNMKAILVFSVVIAHYFRASATFDVGTVGGVIYITSFSFIMQGFLFVSGYFSKNVQKCRKTAFQTFLFPYLILMPIMYGIRYFLFGNANFDLLLPTMALWYLLNLFVYRFFIQDLAKIKYILPISVVLSLAAGCIVFLDETLSLGRIFAFLPFYLLGYFCTEEHVKKVQGIPKALGGLLCCMLIGFSVAMSYFHTIPLSAWYFKRAYEDSGQSYLEGTGARILLSVVALMWIVVFMILTPKKKTWLATVGQNTMSVYILHIIVRYVIKATGVFNGQDVKTYFFIFVVALASVWLFSRPKIATTYQKAMDLLYAFFRKVLFIGRKNDSQLGL